MIQPYPNNSEECNIININEILTTNEAIENIEEFAESIWQTNRVKAEKITLICQQLRIIINHAT